MGQGSRSTLVPLALKKQREDASRVRNSCHLLALGRAQSPAAWPISNLRRAAAAAAGWRWIASFLRLMAYAILLLPGFLQVGGSLPAHLDCALRLLLTATCPASPHPCSLLLHRRARPPQMVAFYFLSPRVKRSIRYGPRSRNVLDIFLPPPGAAGSEGEPLPVVVYVTGERARKATLRLWGACFGCLWFLLLGWACWACSLAPKGWQAEQRGWPRLLDGPCAEGCSGCCAACRRGLDHRLQGLGCAAVAAAERGRRAGLLPGLPVSERLGPQLSPRLLAPYLRRRHVLVAQQ